MLRAVGKARFFGQSNFMKTSTTRSALWEKLDFAFCVIVKNWYYTPRWAKTTVAKPAMAGK